MSPQGLGDMLRQMAVIEKEKPDYVQLTGGSFEDPQVSLPATNKHRIGRLNDRTRC